MALDKAVDSAQLDAGLLQIANAIREKAGVGDNFTFPTGFAEAIAAIETGGGGVAYGSVTPTSNSYNTTITHNLGVIPDLVFFWMNQQITSGRLADTLYCGVSMPNNKVFDGSKALAVFQGSTTSSSASSRWISGSGNLTSPPSSSLLTVYGAPNSATETTFRLGDDIGSMFLRASCTYHWVAIRGLS